MCLKVIENKGHACMINLAKYLSQDILIKYVDNSDNPIESFFFFKFLRRILLEDIKNATKSMKFENYYVNSLLAVLVKSHFCFSWLLILKLGYADNPVPRIFGSH